jgi:uncharacterized protein YneF (UPF0154 family)
METHIAILVGVLIGVASTIGGVLFYIKQMK